MDPAAKKTHPCKSTTHEERFMHFRMESFSSKHPLASHVTVFLRKEGNNWSLSYALCSTKDQFSRRLGRQIARRRFFQDAQQYYFDKGDPKWENVRQWMDEEFAAIP